MKHSVFWKIIIGLLIIITLAEAVMLFVLYNQTYDYTVNEATERIKSAAYTTAFEFENFDPNYPEDYKTTREFLNSYCQGMNITYLYVIKPDLKNRDELYLATGWGENASEEFVNNRYTGYIAKGKLKDEQIRAFNGEKQVLIRDKNRYDDTIICYTPVTRHYSSDKHTFVNEISSIVCAEVSLSSIMEDFNQSYNHFVFIILFVTVLIFALTGLVLYFRVSRPLRMISKRMKGFVSNTGEFFEKLPVKGKDEIAEMSESFNTMAQEIDQFITKLSELNRQKAELNIAKTIQRGLLEPRKFDGEKVSITASMQSAKDVGGDLYDYHILDNGNVFVAIADVSGKGVTAALFMSRAITLLNQYARLGYSPEKMLFEYNNSLAGHNPNRMFITTFAAVYNPETKELTYSNAGHNYPYILSDKLIKLDNKHGPASGVFKNSRCPEYTLKLKPGDRLFMFTDGVTEAQNKEGELFGEERLESVFNNNPSLSDEKLVSAVLDEVKVFTNGAEQADDITMLALQIKN